ncbi:MAG TPA: HNH endonuclease, partial [Pirellulales bacterium]
EQLDFLYVKGPTGSSIELRPGVAYCFRQFYELLTDLFRGAWLRLVRALPKNQPILGSTTDLAEFLFGSERANLAALQPVLEDLQHGRCFYCSSPLRRGASQVDHFIPWSRYPVDLGHNFVLAHDSCNAAKADHVASTEHLASWRERNDEFGPQLGFACEERQMVANLTASVKVAEWTYGQVANANGLTWLKGKELIPLPAGWHRYLDELPGL